MKAFIIVCKILLTIILMLNCFFWLAAHASSHRIPPETDWMFAITGLTVFGLLLCLVFRPLGKRRT